MQAYEAGGHAYHATLPTDGLVRLRDAMDELRAFGFERARDAQAQIGRRVRALLAERGAASVAAPGFEAPGVVVAYTDRADWHNASAFAAQGLQIAAGVPLACDEGPDFRTFRIGLFGIDKWMDVERTVRTLGAALDAIG
jgi:aspartate aminotransferase-like enzyme